MVKLINRDFGNAMYVDEARLEEYLAAGHKLAAAPPADPAKIEPVKAEKPAKAEAKKPAAKKKAATKKK